VIRFGLNQNLASPKHSISYGYNSIPNSSNETQTWVPEVKQLSAQRKRKTTFLLHHSSSIFSRVSSSLLWEYGRKSCMH